MKYLLLAVFGLTLYAPAALCEPISLRDAMYQLERREATQLEGVLLSGTPAITGVIDDQSFTASMYQCASDSYVCRVIVFRTCKAAESLPAAEALKIANTYNLDQETRGHMVVTGSGRSPSLCVQVRFDLDAENVFDQSEAFFWRETVQAFVDQIDGQLRSAQARNILSSH